MSELIEQMSRLTYGKIDTDSRVISGVSILRETSGNNSLGGRGRRYSKKALESVAKLVTGKKAYADHASEAKLRETRGVRSVRDMLGYFTNGRVDGGKVTADLHYLEGMKELIVPIAEDMSDKVGLSMHAFGPSALDRQSEEIVEDVTTLKSVDLVTEPGSTTGLFESREGLINPAGTPFWFSEEDLKQCEADLQEIEFLEAFGIRPDRRDRDEDDPDEQFRREYGIHPDRKEKKLSREDRELKGAILGYDLFN